jgi:hypothetical protein
MPKDDQPELTKAAKQKAGHYEILGETYAKFEFFENGWNPYSRFLDIDKVDLILRRRHAGRTLYREVQVKYGKLFPCGTKGTKWERRFFDVTSWRFFRETEFDEVLDNPHFFVAYVLAEKVGYRGDMFVFPVKEFVSILKQAIPSNDKRKVYLSRVKDNSEKWVLRRMNGFAEINEETTVDVSRFRRNFASLLN